MKFSSVITLAAAATSAAAKQYKFSANSWGDQRVDILGLASDSTIWHKYHIPDPNNPFQPVSGFEKQDGDAVSTPAVTSWGQDRLDYFAIGAKNVTYHRFWDGNNWQPALDADMEELAAGSEPRFASDLSACAWGPGRLDVVAALGDGSCGHLYYDGNSWNGWESLGGKLASAPSILSWSADRFDILAIGANGTMIHQFYDGSQYQPGWQKWEDLGGGPFIGSISTTSWGEGRLDVFAVMEDGGLSHLFYQDGSGWGSWESLGGNFSTAPSVAHWSENRIDIVGQFNNDTSYQYKYWSGQDWQPSISGWESKGGDFASQPVAVSWGLNILNILGIDTTGQLRWQLWAWGSWYPNATGYFSLGDTDHPYPSTVAAGHGNEEQVVIPGFKAGL